MIRDKNSDGAKVYTFTPSTHALDDMSVNVLILT